MRSRRIIAHTKLLKPIFRLTGLWCGFIAGVVLLSAWNAPSVHAAGASLYLSPASGSFVADSTFDLSVLVNTGGQAINTVSVDLTYPPELIQVVAPAPSSSFVSVWIAPPTFSNTNGTIHLEGGAPHPGLTSSAGNILTITFRAKAQGKAKIKITDTSKVLADDGSGTNILTSKNDATLTITAKPPDGPTVSSNTHPDQNSWYKDREPNFAWESKLTLDSISWVYDQNTITEPDTSPEDFASTVSPVAAEDGAWYFHLRGQSKGAWGGTTHYLTQIDTVAPADFKPVIDPSRFTLEQKPVVSFITTDTTSGVDHYEIKIEKIDTDAPAGFFTEQQSPYVFPQLEIGRHQVAVRAIDKAGNSTESHTDIEVLGISRLAQGKLALSRFEMAIVSGLLVIGGVGYALYRRRIKLPGLKFVLQFWPKKIKK